jgi:hypothetical protein
MKILVENHTITALNNLKGLWLLSGDDIMVIRDFKYETVTETPAEVKKKKHFFVRESERVDATPKKKTYVTSITIEGYHPDLKFVGNYNEEFCGNLVAKHNDPHYTLNLIEYRKAWVRLKEQIDAFTENETKLKKEEVKICNCDGRDMPVYEEDGKRWCPQCGYEVK